MSLGPYIDGAMAGVEVISGLQQADMIQRNAQLSERVNELNAKYADIDAYNARVAGYSHVARYQTVIDQTIGAQREAMAAKGQDVNFGTGAEVQAQSKLNGFLNQLDIQNQARNTAAGYTRQAMGYRLNEGSIAEQANINASGAMTRGLIAGGTLAARGITEFEGGKTSNALPVAGRRVADNGSTGYLGNGNYAFNDEAELGKS